MNLTAYHKSISDHYAYLKELKGSIGSLFSELIQRFTIINKRIDEFFTMIKPYIYYFYTTEENIPDTFLHDVILGTKDEINGYIDTVVKYMIADRATNREVEEAINKTLTLSNSVAMILDAVEAIDLYAKNTMIISIKAGEEGSTLTTIAVEMSHLADMVNDVSSEFQEIIDYLHQLRIKFNNTCQTVDAIVENYLTHLQIKLNNSIQDIISHQKSLSHNVESIVSFADQLNSGISGLLQEFQVEDIVRQDIEKILFALEALEEFGISEDHADIILWGMYQKVLSLQNDFVHLYTSAHDGISTMKNSVEAIAHEYTKTYESVFDGTEFNIDKVYNSLDVLQQETVRYLEEILEKKAFLLGVSGDVLAQLRKFQDFFNKIQDVVRKFDVVNMLTRIELARHRELQKTIASSLSDISIMPKKIKKIVEESENLYKDVIGTMESTYKLYEQAMSVQDTILQNCVANLKKVSLKLYESKKYYIDISQQIERNVNALQQFLSEKLEQVDAFRNIEDNLKTLCQVLDDAGASRELFDAKQLDKTIETIEALYANEYKGQMLVSLLKEYSTRKTEDRVIVF
ncbi:MAG: hypothetical protein N3F66_03755 [Spirochaetes bacterium]|nr:hypothetical protein [Spirochaetota bacterium]